MAEVKIIMVMPLLVSDKCVCACIVCGSEVFSISKKIDEFFDAFFCMTSLALSNFIYKNYLFTNKNTMVCQSPIFQQNNDTSTAKKRSVTVWNVNNNCIFVKPRVRRAE